MLLGSCHAARQDRSERFQPGRHPDCDRAHAPDADSDLQRACKVRLDDCLSKDPAAHSTRGPSHGQRREVHAHCDLSGQAPEEVQPASQSLLNVYSAG